MSEAQDRTGRAEASGDPPGVLRQLLRRAAPLLVITLLFAWDRPIHGAIVILLLAAQAAAMLRMLRDPKGLAPWYNATGVLLYVLGMLASAFALGSLA